MTVEERGQLFVGVGEEVYEGMVSLTPPKKMTVEEVIAYMNDDE
eukprot:gene34508-44594_t